MSSRASRSVFFLRNSSFNDLANSLCLSSGATNGCLGIVLGTSEAALSIGFAVRLFFDVAAPSELPVVRLPLPFGGSALSSSSVGKFLRLPLFLVVLVVPFALLVGVEVESS